MRINKNFVLKIVQGLTALILFVLIFIMLSYTNKIQGTARVVNYAGLVRGETQRMVKLEITGKNCSEMEKTLDAYVYGVQAGNQKLGLIRIPTQEFQTQAANLGTSWTELKLVLRDVRKNGYEKTEILSASEEYFTLSNEVVSLAEKYSQSCATKIRKLEYVIVVIILAFLGFVLLQSWDEILILRQNRMLKNKLFCDVQTGLPNKNTCLNLLEDDSEITEETCFFMFDLNNLKYVNDNIGHKAGDVLIVDFATLIRQAVPDSQFVGRYGGDEFIVILTGEEQPTPEEIVHAFQQRVEAFNASGKGVAINYAVGYAKSGEFDQCTLRTLLEKADKRMYENKSMTKKKEETFEYEVEHSMRQMIRALGNVYTDCFYCDAKTGEYRVIHAKAESEMPQYGNLRRDMVKFVQYCVAEKDQERILNMLSLDYIQHRLTKENSTYGLTCHLEQTKYGDWWRITLIYVDSDTEGNLTHFLVLFDEITGEKELEYEAQHDGLTRLWNKTTAFSRMEKDMEENPIGSRCMFVMDLDNFKQVNDTHGHHEGDLVLAETAAIIRSYFRKGDIVARFGGDEFFAYFSGVQSNQIIEHKAELIILDVRKHFEERYGDLHITLSIGIATSNKQTTSKELFHMADRALYQAKRAGKNQYAIS